MRKIIPGELHIVLAERQDQVIGVFWTRNPDQQLANLASATHLGKVDVRPSRHAAKVVKSLAKRLAESIQTQGPDCFWTTSDFEEVVAALEEYDLDRGVLVERAGLRATHPVYIPNLGRGIVTGFTGCGRVIVELDRGNRLAKSVAIASRASVKPVLRPVRP
jgi:hypothetical protein